MKHYKKNQAGFAVEILLIILAAAILVGISVYWLLVLYPKQQVDKSAKDFVSAAVAGEYDKTVRLANIESEGDSTAIKEFAKGIDDGVGNNAYEVDRLEIQGDKATVVFIVNDDSSKTIRLELKKVDGEWLIEGVVYNLGGSSSDSAQSKTAETAASAVPDSVNSGASPVSACLPAASIEKFWRYKYGWEFYFEADTSDINDWGTGDSEHLSSVNSINEMVTFYNDNKQYAFSFVIDVSLYQATGSESDKALALDRANAVAYNMYIRGIPYERMRLGQATSASSSAEYAEGYRRANVTINSSCDALSTPTEFSSSSVGR